MQLAIADANGKAHLALYADLDWPDGVCGNLFACEKVRDLSNDLFTAFGFNNKDALGFFGLFNEVCGLHAGATAGTLPGSLVAPHVMEQLRLMTTRFQLALTQDASHGFPDLSRNTDPYFREIRQLYGTRAMLNQLNECGALGFQSAAAPPQGAPPAPPPAPGPGKGKGKGGKGDGKGKGKGKGGAAAGGGRQGQRPDGAPPVHDTRTDVVIGSKRDRVTMDATHMSIRINDRGTHLKWNLQLMDQIYDRLGENKAVICKACSALRSPHRLEFCCHANDANHSTATSPAHTFVNSIAILSAALDKALVR